MQVLPKILRGPFPSGGNWSEKKVIIYVPNTDNTLGINYSRQLKTILDAAEIAAYEINSDEPNAAGLLANYKRLSAKVDGAKVLICKGMAKLGFSDPEVEGIIYLQPGGGAEFAQSAGRAMRLLNKEKIAYVLAFTDVPTELIFPADKYADEKALERCTSEYRAQRQVNKGYVSVDVSATDDDEDLLRMEEQDDVLVGRALPAINSASKKRKKADNFQEEEENEEREDKLILESDELPRNSVNALSDGPGFFAQRNKAPKNTHPLESLNSVYNRTN